MSADDDARLLAEALVEQRACYEELLGLAEGQREILLADDPDPLLELARKKQGVMDRLDGIGRRMAPARDRWPSTREGAAAALRAEVDGRADEVTEVLTRLLALEEEAARMAGALRDETLGRLKRQVETQKLRDAYRPKDAGGPQVFDSKES